MNRDQLDKLLLDMRLSMLELMVMRLNVALRVSTQKETKTQALHAVQAEYELLAQQLEAVALQTPELQQLDVAQRALYADEFRETIEELKRRLTQMFSA